LNFRTVQPDHTICCGEKILSLIGHPAARHSSRRGGGNVQH